MSYRPTISIYVGGEIADIGYYRNWSDEDLFYEAAAYAALFHKCRTKEEYRQQMFRRQKVSYVIQPERFENTQENLHFLEAHSEFPILVDLTLQNIYVSYGALNAEELCVLHTFDVPYSYEEFLRLKQLRNGHASEYQGEGAFSETYYRYLYGELNSKSRRIGTGMRFDTLLSYYRVPFDVPELDRLCEIYRSDDTIMRHCSTRICELLEAA